jgi:addiction module HigA family antidote
MRMRKNHPHPGRIVRQDFLEPLGLTVTEAAKVLGVARQTVNNLVNERAGISAEMTVRQSKAFGPSADMRVRLQANCDLPQVRQVEIGVVRYKRAS